MLKPVPPQLLAETPGRRRIPLMFSGRWRTKWPLESICAAAILAVVVGYFIRILQAMPPIPAPVGVELLIPAGALYLLAHLCWSSFWVRLLHREGVLVSWGIGLRTYYISQFGKYVPGKVVVLLMRVAMLRHRGGHRVPVAVTATYETLTSMAAGALLAVLFLPALEFLPPEVSTSDGPLLALIALPLGLVVLNRIVVRIARSRRGPDAQPLPAPSVLILMQGLVHGACGYCLLALSLGLTVRALVPDVPSLSLDELTSYLGMMGLAYVSGFVVVVAPGGIGVREFVLAECLKGPLAITIGEEAAPGMAVVIALVLRLTWTISEMVIGLMLYAYRPALPPPPHAALPSEATHG